MARLSVEHFKPIMSQNNPIRYYRCFQDSPHPFTHHLYIFELSQNLYGFYTMQRHELVYVGDDTIFEGWDIIGNFENTVICKKIA